MLLSLLFYVFFDLCNFGLDSFSKVCFLNLFLELLGSQLFGADWVADGIDAIVDRLEPGLKIYSIVRGEELVLDILENVFFKLLIGLVKEASELWNDFFLNFFAHVVNGSSNFFS